MKGTWQTTEGGSGLAVAVAVLAAAVIAVPVIDALARVAEVLVIVLGILAGLALAGGTALAVYRVRQGPRSAPLVVHRVTPVTRQAAQAVQEPQPPAIEGRQVHLHFHGISAEDVAAIIARQNGGDRR